MNFLNAIDAVSRDPNSYLYCLPRLGPLQMVNDFVARPISKSLQCIATIAQGKQFPHLSKIGLDRSGNVVVLAKDDTQSHLHIYCSDGTVLEENIACVSEHNHSFAVGH